jgi:hypothetical protein
MMTSASMAMSGMAPTATGMAMPSGTSAAGGMGGTGGMSMGGSCKISVSRCLLYDHLNAVADRFRCCGTGTQWTLVGSPYFLRLTLRPFGYIDAHWQIADLTEAYSARHTSQISFGHQEKSFCSGPLHYC